MGGRVVPLGLSSPLAPELPRSRAAEFFSKRLAVEQLRDRVGDAALAAEVEDGEDVRVREGRDGLGFTLEARQGGRIVGEMRRQHLDRHVAIELRIARAIDLAHPAAAERRLDDQGPEAQAGRQRHGEVLGKACGTIRASPL